MKEDVFRGMVESFVDETRQHTHGDNVLVVLVQLDDTSAISKTQRVAKTRAVNTAVHSRFGAFVRTLMKSKASGELYPEDFFLDFGDVQLGEFFEDVKIVESAHVIPYISHVTFDSLHREWLRISGGSINNSCVICIDWDAFKPNESRCNIMYIEDYIQRKMTKLS